jgi:hypothetical protein
VAKEQITMKGDWVGVLFLLSVRSWPKIVS